MAGLKFLVWIFEFIVWPIADLGVGKMLYRDYPTTKYRWIVCPYAILIWVAVVVDNLNNFRWWSVVGGVFLLVIVYLCRIGQRLDTTDT